MIYAKELESTFKGRDYKFEECLKTLLDKTIEKIKDFCTNDPSFVKTNGIYCFSLTDVTFLEDDNSVDLNIEQAFISENFSSIDYIVNSAKKDILMTYDEYVKKFDEAIEEHNQDFSELRIFEDVLHHPSFWKPYIDSMIQHGFEVRVVNYALKYSVAKRLGELPDNGFLILFKMDAEV